MPWCCRLSLSCFSASVRLASVGWHAIEEQVYIVGVRAIVFLLHRVFAFPMNCDLFVAKRSDDNYVNMNYEACFYES